MDRSPRVPFSPRLVLGLMVLVAGLLILLDKTGFLGAGYLAGWWPAGIAGLGLLQLVFGDHPSAKVVGLGLILLGAALVFANLNPEVLRSEEVWDYAWPVALVAVGGFLVFHVVAPRGSKPRSGDPQSQVRIFTFWSGQERKVTAPAFEGGELTAIMGGFELDLSEADIPAGEKAVLDVLAVMGGGEIVVPRGWHVDSDVIPIMGGVSVKLAPGSGVSDKHLRIRGLALMGGLEVRVPQARD